MIWFALICGQRSGSHYLRSLLESHPRIAVSGELFNAAKSDNVCPPVPANVYSAWREAASAMPNVTHAGSLLHRDPYRDGDRSEEWSLAEQFHSKFVCLYRANRLRHYLSRKVSLISRKWDSGTPRRSSPSPIRVDPTELWQFVEFAEHCRRSVDTRFLDRIELSYEQLVADPARESRRILDYLGLPHEDLQAGTVKQEHRTLRESIVNYDEIASFLIGKGVEHWLDEPA